MTITNSKQNMFQNSEVNQTAENGMFFSLQTSQGLENHSFQKGQN